MAASVLTTDDLVFEEKPLHVPHVEEVKSVLKAALSENFEHVDVDVVDCPDLKETRFGLADAGLGGMPTLLELGGPPYLLPTVQRSKLYNMAEIVGKCLPNGNVFGIGAGAGPYNLLNLNCEGIYNLRVDANGTIENKSYISKVHGPQEECVLQQVPSSDPHCALLLNLYLCRGEQGKVVKIVCKKRTGVLNFITCIREGLEKKYKDKCVGMGGVFLLKHGSAHQHVMRDFSDTPIHTEEQLNNWLKFYEMPGQLNAVGTLITHENDLDLRLQHFHSFSASNWGGHYHYDTTPDIVEYEAYLNIAERIVRVDKPLHTHKFGRD